MRIALIALLLVHGLIHVLGFLKAWRLADVSGLSGDTLFVLSPSWGRPIGLLWLLCCLVLLGAAGLLLLRHGSWWLVAGGGVLLSQLLVTYAWPDAKAGTLANVVLLAAVVVGAAEARFRRDTAQAVHTLFAAPAAEAAEMRVPTIEALPAPVRRWLEASGAAGKPRAHSVRLVQRGRMRTAPGKASMPAEAHQYFNLDEPGFVWRVRVTMLGLLPIAGRDAYLGGKGRMLIALASLFPLVDASGPKIDQGTLLRFLGEIVWFPSAALSPYLSWQDAGGGSARARMSYRGVHASADFHFDRQGRFVRLNAQRYMDAGPDATPQPWEVVASAWQHMDGVLIPVRGDVRWKHEGGDFVYYEWQITQLERDRPELYPRDVGQ